MTIKELPQYIIENEFDTDQIAMFQVCVKLFCSISANYANDEGKNLVGYELFQKNFPEGDVSLIVNDTKTANLILLKINLALYTFYLSINVETE
jgi:hypothetical protein